MIKIVHLADFQIEARNTPFGNRYDEMKLEIDSIITSIKQQKPDVIVITGDLFQFYNTTSSERKLLYYFIDCLRKIADILATNGNHDLRQTNNQIIVGGKKTVQHDDIEDICEHFDNVKYLKRTGFYNEFGLNLAVWGHYEKFNKIESDKKPYSPWKLEEAKDKDPNEWIELYHDPIRNCKGFSGQSMKEFDEYNVSVNDFKTPLVLMGDIHAPQIIYIDGRTLTYCSSTIMRNYGEGNYYKNGHLYQSGNNKHGYNVVYYDGTCNSKINFIEIEPKTTRHTILLDENFEYSDDNIDKLEIQSSKFNHLRFKISSNLDDYLFFEEKLYSSFKKRYNGCIIDEPHFDTTTGIEYDDEITIDDVEEIISEDKVLELAEKYVESVINKTTTVPKEKKEDAKKLLLDLFKKEFIGKVDININLKDVRLNSFKLSNALVFGDNVELDFSKDNTITRIIGSNAVGKTKIYTLIGYMFTDILEENMKVSQKKSNRLELFNYTRPDDGVYLEMDFDVNNDKYILRKTITRTWKKGINKWKEKDWKSHIVGTPTLEIELIKPNGEIVINYDEIMVFMSSLISSEDFYSHIFVNQYTLTKLLRTKKEDLMNIILKMIGLDIFDPLNATFDNVKDDILAKLSKPDATIDVLTNNKVELEKSLIDTNTSIDLSVGSIDFNSSIIEQIDGIISIDEDSVSNIKNLETIESEKKDNEDKITEISNSKNEATINLEKIQRVINDTDEDKINKEISIIENDIEINNEEVAKYKSKISNIDNQRTNLNVKKENIIKEFENKKIEKVSLIKGNKDDNTNKITKYNERIVEIKGIIQTELSNKQKDFNTKVERLSNVYQKTLDEYNLSNKEYSEKESKYLTLGHSVRNLKKSLDDLIASEKCHSCGEFVSKNTNIRINEIKETIKIRESEFDIAKNVLDKKKSVRNVCENVCDNAKKILDENKNITITYTIKDDPLLYDEVVEIANKISDLNNFNNNYDVDIKNINDDKTYLESDVIKDIELEIGKLVPSIETYKSIIDDCTVNLNKYKESIKIKREIINKRMENLLTEEKLKSAIAIFDKDLKDYYKTRESLSNDKELYNNVKDVFDRICNLKNISKTYKHRKEDFISKLGSYNEKVKSIKENIIKNEKDAEKLAEYKLQVAVVKQYKIMLGKNGLQKYIFGKIVSLINKNLSILLENIPLRIFFDTDTLELRKYDLKKEVISNVYLTSGMETSVLGLSLLKALKTLNRLRKYNFLFVDELSGQMNNGEGLSYKATDYVQVFVDLLGKIKEDTSLYIVDHNIENINENRTIEVTPSKDGSFLS